MVEGFYILPLHHSLGQMDLRRYLNVCLVMENTSSYCVDIRPQATWWCGCQYLYASLISVWSPKASPGFICSLCVFKCPNLFSQNQKKHAVGQERVCTCTVVSMLAPLWILRYFLCRPHQHSETATKIPLVPQNVCALRQALYSLSINNSGPCAPQGPCGESENSLQLARESGTNSKTRHTPLETPGSMENKTCTAMEKSMELPG